MKPGIYRYMDSATYFADPCPEPSLSQSIAKIVIEQSLRHAFVSHPHFVVPDDDEEAEKYVKAQSIGDAAHKLMIGRGKTVDIIEAHDFRGKDAKAERDASWQLGYVPILRKHYDAALKIVDAAMLQLKVHDDQDAFTLGSGEVALIWQDDGIWCRALVDWLHDDLRTVDDYKTSAMSMAPHVIGYRAESAGWHIQAAFIERGLDVLDPEGAGRRRFRFIGQEQIAPYGLTVMHMDEHWLTMGRKKVQAAMTLWRSAIKSKRWPCYPPRGVTPEFPGFKEKQWLERELAGEFESDNDPSLIMAG